MVEGEKNPLERNDDKVILHKEYLQRVIDNWQTFSEETKKELKKMIPELEPLLEERKKESDK